LNILVRKGPEVAPYGIPDFTTCEKDRVTEMNRRLSIGQLAMKPTDIT
jgi:hypothetical protein